MNTLRKSILIGLTVLGMGSATLAAHAQDTATAPAAGRHNFAQMQAKMAEMQAKRAAKLHDLLKLTAAQEPAWTAYQAAIKPAAPTGTPPARGAAAKLSAPDRLSKAIEMGKDHIAKMEVHLTALNTFYAQLTADQKAIFDAHSMGGAHGHHGGWGHRR